MPDGKVTGTVYFIDDTKTYGSKGTFKKRLVVITQEDTRSTNYIPLEFIQDDCKRADSMKVGEEIEVEFILKGREWQKDRQSEVRYFLNAEIVDWKVLRDAPPKQRELEQKPDSGDESAGDIPDDEIPF